MTTTMPQRSSPSRSRRVWGAVCAAILTTLTLSSLAHASEAPPRLAPAAAQALGDAHLSGSGQYRWWGLAVYKAALWVGPAGIDPARLTSTPFVLDLQYTRSLKGRDIAARSDAEMRRIGMGTEVERAAWLQRMHAIFPDVRDGDALSGVFEPDAPQGPQTTFLFNGKPIGNISGDAFARAFFSIWLSPRTSAPDLRAELMARPTPTP